METFLLLLLHYLFMAVALGLCVFVWRPVLPRDRILRLLALTASAAIVLLVLRYPMQVDDIRLFLFVFGLMSVALAASIFLCRPAFRRNRLSGFLTFLACGLVVYLIVWHPWNHQVVGQSTSEHTGIRNRTFHTIWYVIIPIMLGSLLNPRESPRFLHSWKIFCYACAFLGAFNVRLKQYFYYTVRLGEHHKLYLRAVPYFDWAPFSFPVVSLLVTLLVSWLLKRVLPARQAG